MGLPLDALALGIVLVFPQAGCLVILNILRKQRFAVGNDSAYRVGRTNTALSTPRFVKQNRQRYL